MGETFSEMYDTLFNMKNDPPKAWEEMKKQISLQHSQHKLQGKGQFNRVQKNLKFVDPSESCLPL